MDFNFLFFIILGTLIIVLLLLSIRTLFATIWENKTFQENFMSLQEKLVLEQLKQEQVIQKNAYLENYNIALLNKLFEIAKELLLTKKIIFEEHYN